jgi:hypothetical protein
MEVLNFFKNFFKRSPQAPTSEVTITLGNRETIPAEKLIKSAFASKHGLFPHEILALDYAETYYTSGNDFQNFWWNRYGVRDVQSLLNSLVNRGFLEIGDLRAVLSQQTTAAIKDILKSRDLKTTGKKADLVQRILDNVSEAELDRLYPRRTYVLTEIGKTALTEEEYVHYIHRQDIQDLDIWSLNKLVYIEPHMPYRDKIIWYLNELGKVYLSERKFGLHRNCLAQLSRLLREENKLMDSLSVMAEYHFYSLSGLAPTDAGFLEMEARNFFNHYEFRIDTRPIAKCKEGLGYTNDDLKAFFKERMSKFPALPVPILTVDQCIDIIIMVLEKDTEGVAKIFDQARQNFKWRYPHFTKV